jgi:lysozyme
MRTKQQFADEVAAILRPSAPGRQFDQDEVDAVNLIAASFYDRQRPLIPPAPAGGENFLGRITPRVAMEVVSHEAIVLESYKDSKGIWTWGVGVTDMSGHAVGRYKDQPQPIRQVLAIFAWLLKTKFAPDVVAEFQGHVLTEAQFAAALSFHYNTGAIRSAGWADLWRAGKIEAAKEAFLQWKKPPEILSRRTAERDLFFDGVWSNDGTALVIPVTKPSYQPHFRRAARVNIMAELEAALGGS